MTTKKTLRARKYTSPLITDLINSLTDVEKEQSRTRLTLAARIDDYRKSNNLSKGELAEKLNRRPSEITKWLSGTHNFTNNTLVEIAVALNVKIRELYKPYSEDTKESVEQVCLQSLDLTPIVVLITPTLQTRKHQLSYQFDAMSTMESFLFRGATTYES